MTYTKTINFAGLLDGNLLDGVDVINPIGEVFTEFTNFMNGSLAAPAVDINGGSIDGVTIGGTVRGAGSFTTMAANDVDIFDSSPLMRMGGPSGTNREMRFFSNTTGLTGGLRWAVRGGTNSAESTGDAGSDFAIDRYSDSGSYLSTPVLITRSSGQVTFQNAVRINGNIGFNATPAAFSTGWTVAAHTTNKTLSAGMTLAETARAVCSLVEYLLLIGLVRA